MPSKTQRAGKQSEAEACQFLQNKGLILLEQNYFCPLGEIDLIMQDRDDIVFVEVRCRSRQDFGRASETVNKNKMMKLTRSAQHYLQKRNWLFTVNSRFDIIAIQKLPHSFEIEWIKHAFLATI